VRAEPMTSAPGTSAPGTSAPGTVTSAAPALPPAAGAAAGLARGVAIALAVLAAATIEATALEIAGPGDAAAFLAAVAVGGGGVFLLAALARRLSDRIGTTPRARLAWAVGAMLALTVIEMAVREAVGEPLPGERLLLVLLRNLTLTLAVLAHHADAQHLACGLATFLMVFASALANAMWIQGLVILFAIAGVWWLMGSYWETLEGRLTATTARSLPRRWLLLLPAAVLAVLVAVPVARRQIVALDGFMPTSGGRDRAGDWATSGVGDGDQLVAGLDDIKSFAPIDDAPFLASHEPTLFDIFDETFNEPILAKKQERAIGLTDVDVVRREDPNVSTTQRAGREFSLVRKPGRRTPGGAAGLASDAVFHVKGRAPVHLKLESFDHYDGVDWHPEPPADDPPALTIQMAAGRPWLRLAATDEAGVHAAPETHAVRVVHVDTPRIPAPNQLVGIHIADVDRADFFRWAQPGIVALDRERLPELLSISLQSRVVDPRRLAAVAPVFFGGGTAIRRDPGERPSTPEIRALAEAWVADLPRGWRQIERVVERMRSLHELDREARASPDTTDAAAEFLLTTRRGPDYLFAAATVQVLRSLGYAARLAAGFYVDPARFDRRSGHTSVLPEDAHVWVEVACGRHGWVTLDPTPGYHVLGPPPTLLDRCLDLLRAVVAVVMRHPLASLVGLGLAGLGLAFRRRLADAADRLVWRATCRDPATATVRLVGLLDRRCRRAGIPRPRGLTPARWLESIAPAAEDPGIAPEENASGRYFPILADAALYQPGGLRDLSNGGLCGIPAGGLRGIPEGGLCGIPEGGLCGICLAAEKTWSWHHLQQVARRHRESSSTHGIAP